MPQMTLATAMLKLRELAQQADEQRLMVFADEFEDTFPQFAADVREFMSRTPSEALAYLASRHSAFMVLSFTPGAVGWVETLQRAYAARADHNARKL